jgi:hypothetical protein
MTVTTAESSGAYAIIDHADYNTGTNTIHAGGQHESCLLLPVIPERKG